jgi:hypothetical protein
MALDFPSPVSTGTTYSLGNRTWLYNGNGWQLQGNAVTFVASRVTTTSTTATITVSSTSTDAFTVTALSTGVTVAAPAGIPAECQRLIIRIKDNGSTQTITWTTSTTGFRAVGITLPTSTVNSKVLYIGSIWNNQDSYWDAIAVAQQ